MRGEPREAVRDAGETPADTADEQRPGNGPLDEAARGCARIRERLGVDRVSAWILNATAGTVSPAVSHALPGHERGEAARRWTRTPVEDVPLMRQILASGQGIEVPDARAEPGLPADMVADFGSTSLRLEPLIADQPVGVLVIEPAPERGLEDLGDLVHLLAATVGQASARREAERQQEQAELLLDLAEAEVTSGSLAETLGEICERLARHARTRRACLFLLEDGSLRPTMARYADGHQDPEAWARFRSAREPFEIAQRVLETGQPQVAESHDSPLMSDWWSQAFDLGAVLAVPIGAGGTPTGVLTLDDPAPRRFGAELVRLVAATGGQIDGIVARAKADEERSWHLRTLAAVRELLQDGGQAATVTEAGSVLARVAAEAFDAQRALFVRQRRGDIVDVVSLGIPEDEISDLRQELVGASIDDYPTWRDAVRQSVPVFQRPEDAAAGLPPAVVDRLGAHGCAVLPLVSSADGCGVVHVVDDRDRWRRQHVVLAEQLSLEARLIVDNALLREKEQQRLAELAHHATHDPLTGLPNRALLQDRLSQALKQRLAPQSRVAILFVDLDRFKRINDRVGHAVADQLLREVGRRLRGCIRAEDTVARFAGDEFVILLHEVEDVRDAERVAKRIRVSLADPIVLGDHEIFVTASIGIAEGRPDAVDEDWLIRAADTAMFRVKRTGRGRHAVYDPNLDVLTESTLGLESDLHYALERGQLSLRYQPIVTLADGRAGGFEVLLRWEHPEHGMIPPLDFIPMAEATGMIFPIGRWVIDQACQQLGAWRHEHADRDLFVSVNLSPTQVHDLNLVRHVKRALDAAQLPPEALMLEITESSLMHEDEGMPTLGELHRLGVRIAIDDFGTGYSALSYLQRFPIDVLKVDKSFVSSLGLGPTKGALARTVVAIARSLGVTAIAEGIEEQAQLVELRRLGSQMGQGYHFAAPLLTDEAARWLDPDTIPAPTG